jgi:hypothetical protein
LLADTRLRYIGRDIREAQEAVEEAVAEVGTARAAQRAVLEQYTAKIESLRVAMIALVLGALGGWFLVFALSESGLGWWLLLLSALGASVGAWQKFSERKTAEAEGSRELRAAENVVSQKERRLEECKARLEDLKLERDLCRRTASGYRFGREGANQRDSNE